MYAYFNNFLWIKRPQQLVDLKEQTVDQPVI